MQLTLNLVHHQGQTLPLSKNLVVKLLLEKSALKKGSINTAPKLVTPKSRAG